MADIEKRRGYLPRREREARAFRLVLLGGGTGLAGVVTLVLAVAGVMSLLAPIVLLLIAVWCVWRFMRVTGQR